MKKYSVVIAMVLVLALTVSTFAGSFADVPSNHWAYEAVNKLVAAGLIQGYPDGTFKGQNDLTRYEIAVMVARLLNDVEEARAELVDQVDFMVNDALIEANSGLSAAEAEEVQAIVAAVVAKNAPAEAVEAEELSAGQAAEVMAMIGDLAAEFEAELFDIGVKVADLNIRVSALENAETPVPSVTFSGSYAVDFTDQTVEGDVIDDDIDYSYDSDNSGTVADTDVFKDDYVYSDPWDDDSDELAADESDGEVEQTLELQADIVKDGFTATVVIDADEDEDEFEIDAAELALENDTLAAVYSSANTADVADYVFSDAEYNGVNVEFKNLGLNTFFGVMNYDDTGYDQATTTEDTEPHPGVEVEGDFNKYEDDGTTPVYDDDFYVYGLTKSLDLAGLDFNAKFAGRSYINDDTNDENRNYVGFDAASDIDGLAVNFDFAYEMAAADDENDSLIRFGAAKDFDFAGVEFNYKNRGENFDPLNEDDVIFDDDDDDYDEFTTGLAEADTTGWNLTVTPKLFEDIDLSTEVFYASIDENSVARGEETKLAISGEMPFLVDGLVASAEYAIVDPVEAGQGVKEDSAEVGVEYEKDYLTAEASYELVRDDSFDLDVDKSVVAFGAGIADYPLMGSLTASAGFDYEKEAKDFDEITTEYNFGLGYVLGAADLSYDYTNKEVEGTTADAQGIYTTNKVGLTYPIVEGTDFVAGYEILDFDLVDLNGNSDLNGITGDYRIKTATAGVSIDF